MVNELSNFGQGFYPPTCIYSLTGIMGKSLDSTLSTDGRCKPKNLGHIWICSVGITPSNNPGTEREILPYIALYGHWVTPLVMEYNSRTREYCVIISIKYLA